MFPVKLFEVRMFSYELHRSKLNMNWSSSISIRGLFGTGTETSVPHQPIEDKLLALNKRKRSTAAQGRDLVLEYASWGKLDLVDSAKRYYATIDRAIDLELRYWALKLKGEENPKLLSDAGALEQKCEELHLELDAWRSEAERTWVDEDRYERLRVLLAGCTRECVEDLGFYYHTMDIVVEKYFYGMVADQRNWLGLQLVEWMGKTRFWIVQQKEEAIVSTDWGILVKSVFVFIRRFLASVRSFYCLNDEFIGLSNNRTDDVLLLCIERLIFPWLFKTLVKYAGNTWHSHQSSSDFTGNSLDEPVVLHFDVFDEDIKSSPSSQGTDEPLVLAESKVSEVIEVLSRLKLLSTPRDIVYCTVQCTEKIDQMTESPLNADTLIPMIQSVIEKSNLAEALDRIEFCSLFMGNSLDSGKGGWCFQTFYGAYKTSCTRLEVSHSYRHG